MLSIFKSRKASMVVIGLVLLFVFGLIQKIDITEKIVWLVGIYVTGNVAQKATAKPME